jgi:uncharacterized protein
MTRQKKSRKVGSIGIRKQDTRPTEQKESRRKKAPKGQKSGSRNSLLLDSENKAVNSSGTGQAANKKLGSKKKIDLVVKSEKTEVPPSGKKLKPNVKLEKVAPTRLSPEVELANLESDELLISLVQRVEDGEVLVGKDAKYFNRHIARYDELVEILGLENDEDDNDNDNDPYDSLGGDEWDDLIDKG